ncbi:glycosyltransferase family 4 protein [Sphingobacterium sp. DN00404]|uniref:Glycosyltransferase family 4 protein n=1 Tax=Sphingobacterium micropteri TaxID=2763501 RepID=A0ABR7YNA7_9SPHI|nr:glycosyltransferase family 4 protein [Sphingobacterium micropteri]MBD1432777.1 glycosyltransferase family 4 protein [Sphingobacterium micropteri]
MKILYYLPSLYAPGGLERIIVFKANYFAKHLPNSEVVVMTSEQRAQPIHFPLSNRVKHIDLDVCIDYPFDRSIVTKVLRFPFLYLKFKKRFIQALHDEKPDIVISTIRREINFLPRLKDGSYKLAEFHVTKKFYNPTLGRGIYSWINQLKDKLIIAKLRKLDGVVFLTKEEKSFWPELQNLHIIPNPLVIDPQQFSNCEQKQVIAVGRYMPEKGFDLLIESWAKVVKRHSDWTLKIYGEGMRTQLQNQIDRLGIATQCKLEPTTRNIEQKYMESSIFVLSSRHEGFGLVLVEAMACGLPVVSFDCPSGPREIIQEGVDGFLVESGNIEQLAEKICLLIEDKELRTSMGAKARINTTRFTIDKIALQWKELFESLVNK